MFKFLTKRRYDAGMNGDPTKGIEDIVRRNVAALRSKANLTQQGLADEMLLRGIAWTRETVAQVETTNRRLGFTEAIVVAACLDVPVARLTATGAPSVRWARASGRRPIWGRPSPAPPGTSSPRRATPPRPSRGRRLRPRSGPPRPRERADRWPAN